MTNMAKPFLKWAGGKRQLLDEIMEKLPSDVSNCTTYIEPFVGAGAVLFHLLESEEEEFGKLEKFHIIDINAELILCYKALKHDSLQVFFELDKWLKHIQKPMKIEQTKIIEWLLQRSNELEQQSLQVWINSPIGREFWEGC